MSDFMKGSVLEGFKFGEFCDLDMATRRKLVAIMARISECSYRRGFQHGKIDDEGRPTVDPDIFRFGGISLDDAPYTDSFYEDGSWACCSGMTSLNRLSAEHGDLRLVGLDPVPRGSLVGTCFSLYLDEE